jgi:hypothetical protein
MSGAATARLVVRIPATLKAAIDARAAANRRSTNREIQTLIEHATGSAPAPPRAITTAEAERCTP